MTVQDFKIKARTCNFSEEDSKAMLEVYAEARTISYFPVLNVADSENYIFFAPSFLAQALGKFIRDPSFQQLAFRIDLPHFPLYRKYIDTGKIHINLFNLLLKEYNDKEKQYILGLALKNFIIFKVEKEESLFIVPELLPPICNQENIKAISKSDILFVHTSYWTINSFVRVFNMLINGENNIQEILLFKAFARIIFSRRKIIDIYLKSSKYMSLKLVQGNNYVWMKNFATKVQNEHDPVWLNIVLLSEDEINAVSLYNARNHLWTDFFRKLQVEEFLFDRFFWL
eukprot:snap_masked-scaffold_30-processed-gene-2.32-mRNA-1 protein AED:1.00 eAED:1.00 QI:0/-1/0/0/-1/1/1/0/284